MEALAALMAFLVLAAFVEEYRRGARVGALERAQKDLIRVNRALRTLSECNHQLVRAQDEIEVLKSICHTLVTDGGYRVAWVGYADSLGRASLGRIASAGDDEGLVVTARLSWEEPERAERAEVKALLSGRPCAVQIVQAEPGLGEAARLHGIQSAVALPLKNDSRTFGVLAIYAAGSGGFDDKEIKLLEDLAKDLAYGVTLLRERCERAQAEEQVLRLQQAVENSTEVILMTNPAGVITFVNHAFTQTYGYTAEEVVGKTTPRILKGGRLSDDNYKAFWKQISEKRTVRGEFINKTRDGRLLTMEMSADAIVDAKGEITGFLGIQRDITERRRTERALQESEDRYRDLVEHSEELICTHDLHGRLLSVNPAVARRLGYTPQELLAIPMWDLVSPALGSQFNRYLERIRIEGADSGLLRVRTRSGEERTWEYSNTLRTEGVSEPVVRGLAHDVTERLAAERELKKTQERFLQAQKMEAVGRLAGGVAHDFNNLLTIINGYSEIMLESAPAASSEHAHLEQILNAGRRASELTGRLLAFSRKQVVVPSVLDLNLVVKGMANMLERLIGEDIEFDTRLASGLGQIRANASQLEQTIMNLAVNARDAMPKGGRLLVETANAELDLEYTRSRPPVSPGQYVMLAISDSGHGIDAETQSHLFEPFYTTKEQGKGTGLGLSTVFGIVKQHGGHVNVYSEVGRGTTFKLYFPRVNQPAPVPVQPKAASTSLHGRETVLLVEDEPALREMTKQALESAGYTVHAAGRASEALELWEQVKDEVRILLTDVIMPGMNGKELADGLKIKQPGLKVLFMSGYTADAIARQEILDDGIAFLMKPFTPRELMAKLRETIDA